MANLQFGIATADITPPIGVTLWGYNPRPSDSIDHPLRTEALACSDATGGGWILVSADVGGFAAPLSDPVRADIAARTGLPPEAVVVAATHTHSGPHVTDALRCERSEQESAYFRELRARLVDTAARAWAARAPGELVHGETAAPGFGSNRRVQLPDGTWSNRFSDPEGQNPGYNDPAVDLVGIRRPDGALDVLLVNFGCHPVGFGGNSHAISGDYVSYLKDSLEASGAVRTVCFTVSGHGNIDPRNCVQNDPAVVRGLGEKLADIVEAAIPRLVPVAGTGVAAVREPWNFNTTWSVEGRLAQYFPHAATGAPVRTAVSALGAGDLAILGLPGEVVSEYRAKFRRISPFGRTLMVSLANDCIGYLPTDAILKEGAYEAGLSPLSPIETALTERCAAALGRLRAALPPARAG